MNSGMLRVTKHIVLDILRSRILLVFAGLMLSVSVGIFALESSTEKALFGLINLVLFLVPLFVLLFTSVYMYNNTEFIQLMLAQPVKRSRLFWGLFMGIGGALGVATAGALAIPVLMYGAPPSGWLLCIVAVLLLLVFTGISMLISIHFRDKTKGLGTVLLVWLALTLVYDGLMLLIVLLYADYPLETVTLVATMLNPVDIARILLIIQLDQAAMLGFTGVFFTEFFGSAAGFAVGMLSIFGWIIIPSALALFRFNRTDW